jgi:hypothetical protein
MSGDKESLQKYYSGAVQRCMDMFRQLSVEDWDTSATRDGWTAKDYLGHVVTSQEREQNPVTSLNLEGKPVKIPGLASRSAIDEFNQANLDEVRGLPVHELMDRFRASFNKHLAMLEPLTEADLAKPVQHPGLSGQPTLNDLFTSGYGHLPWHYQDIRRCIRKRKAVDHWVDQCSPEEMNDLLGRVFALLPSMYWPERGGKLRATYVFTFPGEGGGQWTIEIDGAACTSRPVAVKRPSIEVQVTPRDWLDIQTKSLGPLRALLSRRLRIKRGLLRLRLLGRFEKLFQAS